MIEGRLDVSPTPRWEEPPANDPSLSWHPFVLVLFRFAFCYLALYALYALSIMLAVLVGDLTKGNRVFLMELALQGVVPWVGKHLLGIHRPIELSVQADSLFEYVQNFVFLGCAALAALVWSILDRKRPAYRKLRDWLVLVLRFTLAAVLFGYGWDKIFPLQFHSISRLDLLQPLGDLNHYNLMWRFMAASKPYTIFSGSLEVLGGILLLVPRLANLGALLSVVVLSNVFALNLAYNVGVSLFSFNLLVIAVFLASPEFPRLVNLLILNRPVSPRPPVQLAERRWIDKGAWILQISLGATIFVAFFYSSFARYTEMERTQSASVPLQGLWMVDEFTVSGEPQHSLFTRKLATEMHIGQGEDRWATLIIETPGQAVIQMRNGVMDYVNLDLDKTATAATLSDGSDDQWKGQLRLQEPRQGVLNLSGEVNGVTIVAKLHRLDESRFILQTETLNLMHD